MSKIAINELDIIYISYDEPNCDENWADLQSKFPHAKRVHGITGFDSAHKAAAAMSASDRFITIDGDTVVDTSIVDQIIEIDGDISNTVFSWPSLNSINGLLYGNGAVKCWTKEVVATMKTHENADPNNIGSQVDFCWDIHYVGLDECFSTTVVNKSPFQAWRAGFREGVKMCLNRGAKVADLKEISSGNARNLLVWMMVGADVENGLWAILGARQGCHLMYTSNWNYLQVNDFAYLTNMWDTQISKYSESNVLEEINQYGIFLGHKLPIRNVLTAEQSTFFKQFNVNTKRQLPSVHIKSADIYDIVMITYGEADAEKNWEALHSRFPRSLRVDGIKGIHNAHKAAAALCITDMFWVVDGDAVILDQFDFDYIVPTAKKDYVYVWRAKNPVNGLIYGHGGIKLLPRALTIEVDPNTLDMTTNISSKYKPVMELASITNFATDEFSTWRSAFRECCKLNNQIISGKSSDETIERLHVWTTHCGSHKYATACLTGAIAGKKYSKENANDINSLRLINDFNWLRTKFESDL
jgi:hypothetical protein